MGNLRNMRRRLTEIESYLDTIDVEKTRVRYVTTFKELLNNAKGAISRLNNNIDMECDIQHELNCHVCNDTFEHCIYTLTNFEDDEDFHFCSTKCISIFIKSEERKWNEIHNSHN